MEAAAEPLRLAARGRAVEIVDRLWLAPALVVPTSVYLESRHFRDGRLEDQASRDALAELVAALVAMAALPRDHAGPPPLAAGRG